MASRCSLSLLVPTTHSDAARRLFSDAGLAQLLGLRSHRELRESPDLAAAWRDVCESARTAGRLDAPAPTAALQTFGCVLASLGRFNEAVPVLETCVSALEQTGTQGRGGALCDALLNLAAVTDAAGRPEDAAALYARAAEAAPSEGGELQKAECLVSQGAVLHRLARLDAAQEVLEAAYQLSSCLGATVAGMRAQGTAAHALACVLVDAKRQTANALRLFREALSMGDQCLDRRGEGDPDAGAPSYESDALARLVALLHTRLPAVCDDVDAALEAATASPSANGAMSSPRVAHSAFHPDPDMPIPSDLAAACEDAATRLVAHGASEAAVQLMERSLALLTAALGTDNHNIGAAAERLAALHAVAGRWEDARPLFERALRVAEAAARAAEVSIADRAACVGPGGSELVTDTPPVLHAAHNLAACLEALERWDQAAALRQRVLRSSERGEGDAFAVGKAAHAAAACEEAQAHGTEAQVLYEKALRMFDSAAPKADGETSEGIAEYVLPAENTMQLLDLPTWPALHRSDPLRSAPAALARSAARTCNALAMLHRSRGHPAAAAPLLLRSLALRRAACDNAEEVSVALTNLAGLLRSLGRAGDAVPLLRACVAIWDPNDGHVPISATLEDDAAVRAAGAHHNLGLALRESGDLIGGLSSAARSVSLYVAALGEAHPHTRAARQSLDACMAAVLAHADAQAWATELAKSAVVAHASGRLLEALLLHTPLVQVLESQEAEARDRVAAAEDTHARLLLALGRPTEAVPHAQRALHAAAAVLGPESLDVAAAAANLGQCLDMCGQPGAATPHLGRALELRERLLGANHPSVGDTLLSLGTLWEKLSRREDAERCFRRAVAVGDVFSGTCAAHEAATAAGATARALNALGLLLHATERAAEAKQVLQRSLALRCAADATATDVAVAAANLGTVHLTLNELDEAVACYTRALNLWTAASAGSLTLDAQARAAGTLSSLGLIARKRGRFREAAAFLERSLAAWAAVASHGGDDAKHDDAIETATVALEGLRRQLANTAHDDRDDEDEDAAAAWAAAATCVSLLNLNDCTDATDKAKSA